LGGPSFETKAAYNPDEFKLVAFEVVFEAVSEVWFVYTSELALTAFTGLAGLTGVAEGIVVVYSATEP